MQFIFIILTIFFISVSQADANLESMYLGIAEEASKKSIYPRYSGERYQVDNEGVSAYLHQLLSKYPILFEKEFPSSTIEEINRVLDILKSWVKYQRRELNNERLWGSLHSNFLPREAREESFTDVLENSKRLRKKYISVFSKKIDKLREKRKKLYPPKLSLMNRCALFFKKMIK